MTVAAEHFLHDTTSWGAGGLWKPYLAGKWRSRLFNISLTELHDALLVACRSYKHSQCPSFARSLEVCHV